MSWSRLCNSTRLLAVAGNRLTAHLDAKKRPDCRLLLVGLLTLLVASPFLADMARPLMLVILLAGVFLAGVLAADADPLHVRRALIIAAVQIATTVISLFLRETDAPYVLAVSLSLLWTAVLI